MRRETLITLSAALLLGVLGWLLHQGTTGARAEALPEGAPLEYLPSAQSASWLALGHTPAAADVFWIRAVLYFTGELQDQRQFTWLRQYIDLVVALDPQFVDIYRWAGTVLLFSEWQLTVKHVLEANRFLEEGARRFPEDWRLPMTAMANCSYYLQPTDPAEIEALKACRLKFLRMAAYRPGAPYHLPLLLASESGEATTVEDRQRLCQMMLEIYLQSRQPELKDQLQARAKGGFCGAMTPEEIDALDRQFDTAHQRRYPYLPPDLFVQVVDTQRAEADHPIATPPKPSEP